MLGKLAALILLGTSLTALADPGPHWEYSGEHGPANWGKLGPANALCETGKAQSPIDIKTRKVSIEADAPALEFGYQPVALALLNNGHTIQVNTAQAGQMTVGGHAYTLAQYHFHTPSEERIDGKSYDLVAHLVHRDDAGRLAVVAVLFKQGRAHAALQKVLDNMPLGTGPEHIVASVVLDATDLLPRERGYYHFEGSLTTPPCSEGVMWYVLKTPVEASASQIRQFHKLYNHTNRPVQALNGRVVVERP